MICLLAMKWWRKGKKNLATWQPGNLQQPFQPHTVIRFKVFNHFPPKSPINHAHHKLVFFVIEIKHSSMTQYFSKLTKPNCRNM